MSYAVVGELLEIELFGAVAAQRHYVAVGFSLDNLMVNLI